MNAERQLTYAQAINEATDQCLANDPRVFLIGEGVPDLKGIFGSTSGLQQKYGKDRVMDMPVSENGLTGICIGAALRGMRPILTHQRIDFALYSFDQIINNAAKWYYMFGGQMTVPLVIRMVIGRGWGQGAQHSQNLQALFAHIPGLKVIMPTTPADVKGLLISAVQDNGPVICLEHRWLYNLTGPVASGMYTEAIGKARRIAEGSDITIVASSYMTVEATKAIRLLKELHVSVDLIDLRTIKPWDRELVFNSVKKTGRLIVVDSGWMSGGIPAEIITAVAEEHFTSLKDAPRRITLPDIPTPSSPGLTKYFYPNAHTIVKTACDVLRKDRFACEDLLAKDKDDKPHDVPDLTFAGPF